MPGPIAGTHYNVQLGVSVVDGAARWVAWLVEPSGEQIGSAVTGATAGETTHQLGAFLVDHVTRHTPKED